MRFSIIVPVYNAREYLDKCIESVRQDPGSDWELILVNDGSTDGSGVLCQQYAAQDSRIWVIHQQNRGPGGARNTGLQQARGEYCWFVDSDDSIVPGALDLLRLAVEEFHADVYSFDYLSDDGKGRPVPTEASFGSENTPFVLRDQPDFLNSMPATWLRLWKRSLFEDHPIRFPDRAFYGEDLRTCAKLFSAARSIVLLRKPLYRYLDRPGSLMNQASEDRNRHMLEAVADLTDWYAQSDLGEICREQLTRLAVEHLLLATTVRICKANPRSPLLEEIRQFMDSRYPRWKTCRYVRQMGGAKRLALFLAEHRFYRTLGWLFRMKGQKS